MEPCNKLSFDKLDMPVYSEFFFILRSNVYQNMLIPGLCNYLHSYWQVLPAQKSWYCYCWLACNVEGYSKRTSKLVYIVIFPLQFYTLFTYSGSRYRNGRSCIDRLFA